MSVTLVLHCLQGMIDRLCFVILIYSGWESCMACALVGNTWIREP